MLPRITHPRVQRLRGLALPWTLYSAFQTWSRDRPRPWGGSASWAQWAQRPTPPTATWRPVTHSHRHHSLYSMNSWVQRGPPWGHSRPLAPLGSDPGCWATGHQGLARCCRPQPETRGITISITCGSSTGTGSVPHLGFWPPPQSPPSHSEASPTAPRSCAPNRGW